MKRRSRCEWMPMLPWPIWPLAGHARLGQNVVVGSMTILLSWLCWGGSQEEVCLDPCFLCNLTPPRFSVELPGEFGVIVLQRSPQHKLHDRQHADTESQQVREALDLVVEFDKEWCNVDPALEAVEDAFHAVFMTIAQHRLLQRQLLWCRIGDKGLPAKTLTESGDGVCLASDVGNVVAGFLDHPLLAVHRAAPPADILRGLLDLLFPCHAE